MDWLRLYLLLGLVVHKAVWELMKRRDGSAAPPGVVSLRVRLVKAVKIAILIGIVVQTLIPDVLPISADPAVLRMTGFGLYTLGLATALTGRIHLGENWLDIETAGVKRKQATVTNGIYQYVRHPIYTGDLLLLLGLELALNSWLVVLILLLTPVILKQAIREEQMLKQTLPGYDDYCQNTRRFIPFLA